MSRTWKKLDCVERGVCKKISFDDLWLIFPPGCQVYSEREDRLMVVYSRFAPERNQKGQLGPMVLNCWSARYHGGELIRDYSVHTVQPYLGEEPIRALKLVPLDHHERRADINRRLMARGERYFQLNQSHTLQDYTGSAFPRVFKDEAIRVVADQDTFEKHNPNTHAPSIQDPSEEFGFRREEESLVDSDHNPRQDALACCHPSIGVYSLRDKEWKEVKVDDLRTPQFRQSAFKRLAIKKDHRRILVACVDAYMSETPGFTDLVAGKGRGLVVLLHGSPGVGKTLTAESISEYKQRPLYPVSCGELGTDPLLIEKRLKEVFYYAVTWKAILLLDEADIFLQERNMQDVQRNALVSVFLRELEHFDGILFMTTNRPGEIDEAFHARIHVSIHMPPLDVEQRRKVWGNFVRDLDSLSDRSKDSLLRHVFSKYDNENLNGREIRNTMRTAIALAQLEGKKLGEEHIDQELQRRKEFKDFIRRTWKM